MQIEIGKVYKNKTWKFLLVCLKGYGDVFVRKFNPLFKLGMGVGDDYMKDVECCQGKNLFIMIDKLSYEKLSEDFLRYVRYQTYYKYDYAIGNRKHMIVLSIPEIFEDAYDQFMEGRYSMMFSQENVKLLFSSSERKEEYGILMKEEETRKKFIKKVNEEFGTSVQTFDTFLKEYEFPPNMKEEIFNYQEEGEYSTRETHKI